MSHKPDILEFLRRKSGDKGAAPEAGAAAPSGLPAQAPAVERTTRIMVLRRSQVVVAVVALCLGLVLCYLVGRASGERRGAAAAIGTRIWTIRVISYPATDRGRLDAEGVVSWLERQGIQAAIQPLSSGHVAVIAGAWLKEPGGLPEAAQLLQRLRQMPDAAGKKHFQAAYLWRIER